MLYGNSSKNNQGKPVEKAGAADCITVFSQSKVTRDAVKFPAELARDARLTMRFVEYCRNWAMTEIMNDGGNPTYFWAHLDDGNSMDMAWKSELASNRILCGIVKEAYGFDPGCISYERSRELRAAGEEIMWAVLEAYWSLRSWYGPSPVSK